MSNQHQHQRPHQDNINQVPTPSPSPLPLFAITGLSHILTTSEACHILGKTTTRAIVKSFLRYIASNSLNTTSTSTNTSTSANNCYKDYDTIQNKYHNIPFKYIADNIIQESETEEEKYWIDIITASLAFDFSYDEEGTIEDIQSSGNVTSNSTGISGSTGSISSSHSYSGNHNDNIPEWCSMTWHRILNLPPPRDILTSSTINATTETTTQSNNNYNYHQQYQQQSEQQQPQQQPQQQRQIPSPILGLDKTSFLKAGVIFPSCTAPHREKDGHMVLMEYVFSALATPSPVFILNKLTKILNRNNNETTANNTSSNSSHYNNYNNNDEKDKVTLRHNANSVYRHTTSSTSVASASSVSTSEDNNNLLTSTSRSSNHYTTTKTFTTNYKITGMNEQRVTKSIILLPDLIIFWAISKRYQNIYDFNGIRKVGSTAHTSTSGSVPSPPASPTTTKQSLEFTQSGLQAISHAAEIAYRIYNALNKRDVINRDVLNQFMSDIYGSESILRKNANFVLDRMFLSGVSSTPTTGNGIGSALPHPPTRHLAYLNHDQFIDSIQRTTRIVSKKKYHKNSHHRTLIAEHKVIDWLMSLGSLPHFITNNRQFYTSLISPSPSMELSSSTAPYLSTYRFLQAKMEMLQHTTMDIEIRKLCRKFGIIADSNMNLDNTNNVINNNSNMNQNHTAEKRSTTLSTSNPALMQLFEVKRRFRSVVELMSFKNKGRKHIIGDLNDQFTTNSTDTHSTGSSSSDDNDSQEGRHLPIDEDEGKQQNQQQKSSSNVIDEEDQQQPSNVINEEIFLQATTEPNEDLGHGGFLTPSIAKLVFQAGCATIRKNRKQAARKDVEMFIKSTRPTLSNKTFFDSCCSTLDRSQKYWTLYDVLSFGCNAVRVDMIDDGLDNDTLLRFIFSMFLLVPKMNNGPEVPRFVSIPSLKNLDDESETDWAMTRYQVGYMLLLLIDHVGYRSKTDTPPNNCDEVENETLSLLEEQLNGKQMEDIIIDASAVNSTFGSLPLHFISRKEDSKVAYVSLKSLVDIVFKASQSSSDKLSYQGFVNWTSTSAHEKSPIGSLILDLRLIASTLFGIKPSSPKLEDILVREVFRRYNVRCPATEYAKRGPLDTVWYIVPSSWWRNWEFYVLDKADVNGRRSTLSQIETNKLLVDNGSLALRPNLRFKQDFQVRLL